MGKAALFEPPVSGDALWSEEAWLKSGWIRPERDTGGDDPLNGAPEARDGGSEALTLEDLRRKGARFLTRSNWLLGLIVTFMAIFASSQVWWVALTVLICALLQTYASLRDDNPDLAGVLVAIGTAPIPTCIIFAFRWAGLDPDLPRGQLAG